jgi:aminoglycoside 6'-N-acetyltransferase I
VLGRGDAAVLDDAAPGVFDHGLEPRWRDEFFADPRHHLAVAMDGATVVGMVSAVHYVHPDKAPELWINEVGVAPSHRRMGLARGMLDAMLAHARTLGCGEAWVLTDVENGAAMRLYASAGGAEQRPQPVMFNFRLDGEG